MTRICIVDDHELLLNGMASILNAQPDFEVSDTFTMGLDLLESDFNFDVLILDVNLKDIDAEDLLKKVREKHASIPIIYLTILRGQRIFHRLEKYTIQGYVLKDIAYEELYDGIRKVAKGGTYFAKDISLDFEKDQSIHEGAFVNQNISLSPREKEILRMICDEHSSAQIADKLFISAKTVDTHRQNLMIKLGVNNAVGLVKYAFQNQLL
ncbi:MAG: LuxR C-terminal-related transcriptional regulator [Leadbetterella sp.]